MTLMLQWRRGAGRRHWGMRRAETLGVIMVYDSQYTCDQCTAPRPPGHARRVKNATVIAVCRRMLQAVTDRRVVTRWVKVKGHSGHEGNNAADDVATWGQNGGSKNVENMTECMDWLWPAWTSLLKAHFSQQTPDPLHATPCELLSCTLLQMSASECADAVCFSI